MNRVLTAGLAAGLVAAALNLQAADVPLGHKDFYPSDDHPVMERGDMTGVFPGAKDVALEWDHRTGKNIIWKCRMPYWSNSAPIVVGKKAFVGSEPDELVCVDAEKGTVLWKRSIFIDEFIPAEDREGVRKALREANDEAMALDIPGPWPARWLEAVKPLDDDAMAETARRIAGTLNRLKAKGLPTKRSELRGVDTGAPSREGLALLEKHKVMDWGRDAAKFGPFPHGTWGYHLGFTMPSPTSDGKHVWYQTSLGAVACLDLDGKVVWSKRLRTVGPTSYRAFTGGGSPVLVKDKLYYHDHLAQREVYGIVAVDKNTGKEVWRRPRDRSDKDYCGAGGRGSSGIVPLRLGGKDFLATPGRYILDAATGETVGDMGLPIDARRAHAIGGNSLIFVSALSGNWVAHVRLGFRGDQVAADLIWKVIRGTTWNSAIVYEGNMYMPKGMDHRPLGWYPLEKPKDAVADKNQELPRAREIPAAKCFFTPPRSTDDDEDQGASDPWQYSTAAVAEGHLFVGDDKNGMQVFRLDGEKSAVVCRNFMDLWVRANPFFQGNRMYVRTMHYLYCIGEGAPVAP